MSNPVQPLSPAQTALARMHAERENFFFRALREIDVMLNVDTDGLPGQTLSARWAGWAVQTPSNELERAQKNFGVFACHALNIAQPDHGALAVAGDEAHGEKLAEAEKQVEAEIGAQTALSPTPAEPAQ